MPRRAPASLRIILFLIQITTGIGAFAGGVMLVLAPDGSLLHLPLEFLSGSVFPDYLIPGLALSGILGLGNLAGSLLTARNHGSAGAAAMVLGAGMLIWLGVQLEVIGARHWLQAVYAAVGCLEILLGYSKSPSHH